MNGVTYYKSGNQWAPRISVAVDPIGDQRTKLYGFFGRYYLPVPTNTNIRLAGAELDYTAYFRATGVGANNVPILGSPVNFSGVPCPGRTPGQRNVQQLRSESGWHGRLDGIDRSPQSEVTIDGRIYRRL